MIKKCLLLGEWCSIITGHRPEKSTSRSYTAIGSIDKAQGNCNTQDCGGDLAAGGLEDHLSEGALSGRCEKEIEVDEAEEHDQNEHDTTRLKLVQFQGDSMANSRYTTD